MNRQKFFFNIVAIVFVFALIRLTDSSQFNDIENVSKRYSRRSNSETVIRSLETEDNAESLNKNFGRFYRAFCNKTEDCRHAELICFQNHCRPNLNCRTGSCGGLRKWKETENCTLTDSCKPKNQTCVTGECAEAKPKPEESVEELDEEPNVETVEEHEKLDEEISHIKINEEPEKWSLDANDQINGIPIRDPSIEEPTEDELTTSKPTKKTKVSTPKMPEKTETETEFFEA